MLRQYEPAGPMRLQTLRAGNVRRTVYVSAALEIGQIVRLTTGYVHRARGYSQRGEPCIITGFKPREITAWFRNGGRWDSCFVARGGHLVTLRSLRDGRTFTMADHIVRHAAEA